ncbi:MAG: dihydrolipoyl dehydrogenase [Nitrospinota bacterium]|nr:dihydrolipoyl dehydrogenase [Nitrospinota bacterium]
MDIYDLVVIGGGPAGYNAALELSKKNKRCIVIDKESLGGTCLHLGCIPSKSLISSANLYRDLKRSNDYGISLQENISPDLQLMVSQKNKIVGNLERGIFNLFKKHEVEFVQGFGEIEDVGIVRVKTMNGSSIKINAKNILIATGSRPKTLPIFPLDGDKIITSDQAVNLEAIPKRLLVVGGGYIGCELACFYNEIGSDVHLTESLESLIHNLDNDVSKFLEREFKKQKIKVHTKEFVTDIKFVGGKVLVRFKSEEELEVDKVLIAVGRSPNSEGIGLEKIGVKTGDDGFIVCNENMKTNIENIYVAGDVTGKIMLAHVASYEGFIVSENISGISAKMDYSLVPSGIFTHPEIGSVGLSEKEAVSQGNKVKVGRFDIRGLGKAHADRTLEGFVKIISREDDNSILGVHIIGSHAADLVHEGVAAMRGGLNTTELGMMIHSHPTLSEGLMFAALS